MRFSQTLIYGLLCLPGLALGAQAAEKRVYRIDSVIATQKNDAIIIQARGAVQTGGWKNPRLRVLYSDRHTVTVEFLAVAPPPDMTVIAALVPVAATANVRANANAKANAKANVRARAVSVRVLAGANEITTQVLH